jgi:hypothetical protein
MAKADILVEPRRLESTGTFLLAVESTGRLVVIEVKLAEHAESRRAVVAQVLSCAGYLQGLDPSSWSPGSPVVLTFLPLVHT